MSDDVKRVEAVLRKVLWDDLKYEERPTFPESLAPRVLAAIRAAAIETWHCWDQQDPMPPVAWTEALDAALAALTDHPGGTE